MKCIYILENIYNYIYIYMFVCVRVFMCVIRCVCACVQGVCVCYMAMHCINQTRCYLFNES